jgi:hypothetical protein
MVVACQGRGAEHRHACEAFSGRAGMLRIWKRDRFKGAIVGVASAGLLSLHSTPALSWGAQGHRLTGLIAYELLNDTAKSAVDGFLERSELPDLAAATTWMDEHRPQLGDTVAQWHFDDIPICETAPRTAWCPDGNCASGELPQLQAKLSDGDTPLWERQEAFLMIVHIVGDINQPLHVSDNDDRGGNKIKVKLGRTRTNLHSLWDKTLLVRNMSDTPEAEYAQELLDEHRAEVEGWKSGSLDDWIASVHQAAIDVTYGELPAFACDADDSGETIQISNSYAANATKLVRQQIVAGGARIAQVLNQALGQ